MQDSPSMLAHFRDMARYNLWANARIYAAAGALADDMLHRDVGVYFGSLFGTLAHILQTDRAWTFLLQGGQLPDMALPPAPADFAALSNARTAQDDLFVSWMDEMDHHWLAQPFTFASGVASWKGKVYNGTHAATLAHLFNHQTHHRGQAHSALSLLHMKDPPALDMLVKTMLGE